MTDNRKLNKAIREKRDEFYTLYSDIENEIHAYLAFNGNLFAGKTVLCPCDDPDRSNFTAFFVANFENLGLKKLVSTCYVKNGNGKILEKTGHSERRTSLNGDGNFNSVELTRFRDEADFIITNPPFSLFREFMNWIFTGKVKFSVICNKNCVTFKEISPQIKNNEIWSGYRAWAGGMWFETVDDNNADKEINGVRLKNIPSIWLTNIGHNRRYEPIRLLSMEENLIRNPKLKEKHAYVKYDNYNAIEVPETKAIPNNYGGVMGVPISFLDKFNANQFEIIGATESEGSGFSGDLWTDPKGVKQACVNKKKVYKRVFVRLNYKTKPPEAGASISALFNTGLK